MVEVNGFPILWYTILQLYSCGVRRFILPLGYRGVQIQAYIDNYFNTLNARIDLIHTGIDAPIGKRLHLVRHLLTEPQFLLINGDCLFDFDVNELYAEHARGSFRATLALCKIISQFGLVLVRDSEVVSFTRDSTVRSFEVDDPKSGLVQGFINGGITLLDTDVLDEINLLETENLEADLFSRLAEANQMGRRMIEDFWFAIETPKDVAIVNSAEDSDPRSIGSKTLRNKLMQYQAKLDLNLN